MKKILLIILVLIITGLIGFLLFLQKKELKTFTVIKKEIIQAVYSSGRIEPENQVYIKSEVSGYVQKIFIRENQKIKRNQKAVQIKNDIIPLQIEEIQKEISRISEKLENNSPFRTKFLKQIGIEKLSLENIQSIYIRRKELFDKKQISEEDFDKIKNQLAIQKNKIQLLESQYKETIKDLQNQLKQLSDRKEQLHQELLKYTIKSPIDGTILKIYVKKGDYLNSMTATNKIALIADLSKLETKLFVDEEYIPLVKKNQKVLISLDAFPDKVFEGKIKKITKKSDTTTRTVEVIADVKYPFIPPSEITVEANIIINKRESLVIPISAVQNGTVKILKNGEIITKKVKTGIKNNGYIEILEGLKEGDKVILP